MKRSLRISIVFLLLTFAHGAAAKEVRLRYHVSALELALIEDVTPYLDSDPDEMGMLSLQMWLDDHHDAVSALVAGILFKHQPNEYFEAIFQRFSVNDYSPRSEGVYNMITQDDVLGAVRALEARSPAIEDTRIGDLLLFLHFRDSNEWFEIQGRKVSAARFFRGAFFAGVLEGSGIDSLELTNAIDRWTRTSTLR